MAHLNSVQLIGNLTRDPELRVTPKGTAICQFGLAVNRKFRAEDGSQREEVAFVDVEAWGKTAELIAKYLQRGSLAMIGGRLKLDQWDDRTTGAKRSKLKVVCDNVQFLGGRAPDGEQRSESPTEAPSETPTPAAIRQAEKSAPSGGDEDVPF